MRVIFSAAASRDSGLGPQLGSGAQSIPCAHTPHFCIGRLLGDACVDAAGSEEASLCRLHAARVSSGVLAPEPRVPHESWGYVGGTSGPCVPPGKLGAQDQVCRDTPSAEDRCTYWCSLWVLGIARACSLPPWTSMFQDGGGLRVRRGHV